jgi:uncharacterized membrane protein
MRTTLLVLLLCATVDAIACGLLLVIVWLTHRRLRKEAAAAGETLPSAAGQFGCLLMGGLAGLAAIYGAAWWLLN